MNSKGILFSSDTEFFSRVINRIRFPLIFLVVMIHSGGINTDFSVLIALDRFMSELLPSCAVPTFFLISGYLYFIGVDALNRETYVKKNETSGEVFADSISSLELFSAFAVVVEKLYCFR